MSITAWIPSRLRRAVKNYYLCRKFPGLTLEEGAYVDEQSRFGQHVKIGRDSVICHSTIDDFSYVNSNSVIQNATLGKFCSISAQVLMGLGSHPTSTFVSTSPYFFTAKRINPSTQPFADKEYYPVHKPIKIGSDVWIGAQVYILDGITIGDGVIVAAGAVVHRDIAPYTIVGGVPAKEIRLRFSVEDIAFLLNLKWWDKDPAWIRANYRAFHDVALLRQLVS